MICIFFYDQIDEDMMTGYMACMRQSKNVYIVLVGKLQ
jgi:hypothetical protein